MHSATGSEPFAIALAAVLATGYLAQKYTNEDVFHFLDHVGDASIVHTFGHGRGPDSWRDTFYITFWKNGLWYILSETSAERSDMPAAVKAQRWKYMRSLENQGKFAKLNLAVFVGCFTAQKGRTPHLGDPSPQNWGSPAAGAICLGAKCAVGFGNTIYGSPGRPGYRKGAEEWDQNFWQRLNEGASVARAAADASELKGLDSTPLKPVLYGDTALRIAPAR